MTPGATNLFVYGTLKRGDVRAPLLAGQTYLGETYTQPRYRLFNTGQYPALVEAAAIGLPGRSIVGELWRVGLACLMMLDEEEGVDEGLYARQLIALVGEQAAAQAYLYLHPVAGLPDCGDHWPVGGSHGGSGL